MSDGFFRLLQSNQEHSSLLHAELGSLHRKTIDLITSTSQQDQRSHSQTHRQIAYHQAKLATIGFTGYRDTGNLGAGHDISLVQAEDTLPLLTELSMLLDVATKTTNTFHQIHGLKHAPAIIQSLCIETAEIQLFADDLYGYVQQFERSRAITITLAASAGMPRMCVKAIKDTRGKLDEVNKFLRSRILKHSSDDRLEVNRVILLKKFGHLSKLHLDMLKMKGQIFSIWVLTGRRL